jgi:ATP-dependent Clp endopeptidase proteolytic subunit ClpP
MPQVSASENAKLSKAYNQARIERLSLIERLSNAWNRREYHLNGWIDFKAAEKLTATLDQWWRIDSMLPNGNRQFRVVLNSVGGSFIACIAIYDFLRMVRRRGFTVTVELAGHGSYQAAIIVQAATPGHRLASPRSYMMIEQLKNETSGSTLQVEHRMKWLIALQRQYDRILSQYTDMSPDEFGERINGRSLCLRAREARRYGLIDEVIDRPVLSDSRCLVDLPMFEPNDTVEERISKAETQRNTAQAVQLDLDAQLKETDDEAACVHRLFVGVDTPSTSEASQAFRRYAARCGTNMELLICSPGGNIVDGIGLYDTMKQVQAAGHKVDTICLGYAASMGGVLLQAGTRRLIGQESWVLVHRASGWIEGTTAEMEMGLERLQKLQQECFDILATGGERRKKTKANTSRIRTRCDRGDWWVPARQALNEGLVCEIF